MYGTVFKFYLFLIHSIRNKDVSDVHMSWIPCTVISTILLHTDSTMIVLEYAILSKIITLFL